MQEDRQAIARNDTYSVLGIHSERYQPHAYDEWLLKQVSTLVGDTTQIGSAGLLKGGAVAWVSIETPDTMKTKEGVEYRPHLLAATSFDGSLATTYKPVVTNVVCDNTMAAAMSERGNKVKVRHTRSSELKLAEARDALGIIVATGGSFEAEVEGLCEIRITDRDLARFLEEWAPLPSSPSKRTLTMTGARREKLESLYRTDPRCEPWKGTAWGVIQSVNTYEHHEKTVRGASRPERNMLRAITGETERTDRETVGILAKILDNR